jgi:hypothetical protein
MCGHRLWRRETASGRNFRAAGEFLGQLPIGQRPQRRLLGPRSRAYQRAAATRPVLDRAEPCAPVGPSFGEMINSTVGTHPIVRSLNCVGAFEPEAGEPDPPQKPRAAI